MDRRSFLSQAAGFGATVGAVVSVPGSVSWAMPPPGQAALLRQQPAIRPRSDWDQGNGPTGPIEPEDPRFLLVHHTAQPDNNYSAEDVPGLLRSMYWFHSGDEKGWADIAYNFLVDQFGTIWEGRTGSIAGPVRGSATGGNQGFSQLCCFIGNLSETDPTQAATDSMVELLAWLAVQRNIDIQPGATVSFTSRGSNKWPQGTEITTPTIAGHRDMSQTSCPGDRGYAFVTGRLPELVLAMVNGVEPPPASDNPDSDNHGTTTEPQSETSTTESLQSSSTTIDATDSAPSTETPATGPNTTSPSPSSHSQASTSVPSAELESELDEDSLADQTSSTATSWVSGTLRWGIPAATIAAGGAAVYARIQGNNQPIEKDDSESSPSAD